MGREEGGGFRMGNTCIEGVQGLAKERFQGFGEPCVFSRDEHREDVGFTESSLAAVRRVYWAESVQEQGDW